MKTLKINRDELIMLKQSLMTRIDYLETDQHKHNHKHHCDEIKELQGLRKKLVQNQLG